MKTNNRIKLNKISIEKLNRKNIIKIIKQIKPILKEQYGIDKIGIFGSFSRNDTNSNSDLDIVVEQHNPDLFDLIGAKQFIEELIKVHVDIVRYRNNMNQTLKNRIDKDAIYV